jgi:hypothetical protein
MTVRRERLKAISLPAHPVRLAVAQFVRREPEKILHICNYAAKGRPPQDAIHDAINGGKPAFMPHFSGTYKF